MERSEYAQVLDWVNQAEPPLVCLLGRPGVGKSALMARLCADLKDEGWAVLGIKADVLSHEVTTPETLAQGLGLPDLAVSATRLVNAGRRVLVVFDQVDALASLLDQRTGRLDAVVAAVRRLRGLNHVAVVMSSREVDYAHDARLHVLKKEAVHLQPLTEEVIRTSLGDDGIDVSGWPSGEPRFGLLGAALYLRIYTQLYAGQAQPPILLREFDLLSALWTRWVVPVVAGADLARDLARDIGEQEELWVRVGRYDEHTSYQPLLSSGIVVRLGERLGFMHQHLFEYIWARHRPADATLAQYVLSRPGLAVRPRFWVGLQYERENNPRGYTATLTAILGREEFDHLSQVALAFVAQVEGWMDEEFRWIGKYVERYSHAVLGSMSSSPTTFGRIRPRLLSLLARGEWAAWNYLARCASQPQVAEVAVAIAGCWLPRHMAGVAEVLSHLQVWLPDVRRLALPLLASKVDDFDALRTLNTVARLNLDEAPLLLRHRLDVRWNLSAAADDEAARIKGLPVALHESERVRFLAMTWYGVSELVAKAPRSFALQIWDFLERHQIEISEETGEAEKYPDDAIWVHVTSEGLHHELRLALLAWAQSDPISFVAFVKERMDRPAVAHHALQCLLAIGLSEVADQFPGEVGEYLMGDQRRLRLGERDDVLKWSAQLIEVAAFASDECAIRLMNWLQMWLPPVSPAALVQPSNEDVERHGTVRKARYSWLKYLNQLRIQARYQLLRSLPEHIRDSDVRYRELHRRFAGTEDLYDSRSGPLSRPVSRMSASSMCAAGALRVRKYLDSYSHAWRFDRPDHSSIVKAATAMDHIFGRSLLRLLRLDEVELVGGALEGLVPSERAEAIIELHERGVITPQIRSRCTHLLYRDADECGLPDTIVDVLECWLLASEVEASVAVDVTPERTDREVNGRPNPMLIAEVVSIVGGEGSQLAWIAILGLTKRPTPDHEIVSGRLLPWIDHPSVGWGAWARLLIWVDAIGWMLPAQRLQASERLRRRFEGNLPTLTGVQVVRRNYYWIPEPERAEWIRQLAVSTERRARQAFGELLGLVGQMSEPAHWDRIMTEPGAAVERAGLAHACLHLWKKAPDRLLLTQTLVQILEIDGPAASWVASDFFLYFQEEVSGAAETGELVRLLAGRPDLMPDRGLNAKALQRLVAEMPDEVATLVERLLALESTRVHLSEVTRIAYALHRMDGFQLRGLAIFNQLAATPMGLHLIESIDRTRTDFPSA